MITKWRLFNFKSVRKETELELGPLTIFAGANSSGKSTVLQSMLLISQTLASKTSSRSVVINGPLTKLGQFDDLRSFGSEADQIFIGWECGPRSDESSSSGYMKAVTCNVAFDARAVGKERDLAQLQPHLFSFELSRTDQDGAVCRIAASRIAQVGRSGADKIRKPGIETIDEASRASLEFDIEIDEQSQLELWERAYSPEVVGCSFRHFLPNKLLIIFDQAKDRAHHLAAAICDIEDGYMSDYADEVIPSRVIQILSDLGNDLQIPLDEVLQNRDADSAEQVFTVKDWATGVWTLLTKEASAELYDLLINSDVEERIFDALVGDLQEVYGIKQDHLPIPILHAVGYLDSFFSNSVRYLGPLRDEPKPLYPLATSIDPADVGLKGEHTAAVFDLHREQFVRYVPTSSFTASGAKANITTRTLESAVSDWLEYMGIAAGIATRDLGKLGHELKVITADVDTPHDLTHVGVGVSQVLPILVSCLLANKDATFIIEQPELHLHPKVQTLLGDFFLSMAMLGKQCIVETHSEYIINRLRFRAATAQGDEVSSLLKVYFVEKKGGASEFRPVNVNKYGAILEWPEGFFDQSQAESEEILRAATKKRKAERKGGPNA